MAVSIQNLRFSYPSQSATTVLDIPSWSVADGESVFIHGPSGTGKSTLLNLLAGILPCDTGRLDVLGQALHTMSGRQRDRFRAQHIGFVFQQFNLIPYLNVLDNVLLGAYFAKRKTSNNDARQLLQGLQLDSELCLKKASELSVGQQQRVAIARALISQPELLIVDEPTSALDSENRDIFMQLLLELVQAHNMTLLFVSHDLSLDQGFDRTVSLHTFNQACLQPSKGNRTPEPSETGSSY